MSKLEVDKIDPQSGTALEIGSSGDTITIPSGATLDASNATTTLPANVVTTDGTQTLTNKSIATTQLTGTITPSDGTVTNAKIVDDAVTAAKLADDAVVTANITDANVTLAKLSATGTKDATTFLRGDNTFATVSSDYVNLTSATVSGSPSSVSIDGFFTSDYDIYVLKIYNFRQSAQTTPFYRFNVSGTPNSTASNYYTITGNWYGQSGTSSSTHDRYWGNQSEARLFNWDISNNSNEVSAWETIINNPLTAGDHNLVETRGVINAQNLNTLAVFHAATQFRTGNAISGITVYAGASSNISELKYSLYGLKK